MVHKPLFFGNLFKLHLTPLTLLHFHPGFETADCQVMMASQRCGEEDAEAILSNLKMEGRVLQQI